MQTPYAARIQRALNRSPRLTSATDLRSAVESWPPPLGSQRAAFQVPDDVAYFNTASLAPQLTAVRAAGMETLERQARPWETDAPDWFSEVETLRELFARVAGAPVDGVALVPATSYGLGVAARNLPLSPGERIVVLAEEYPSGIYTWRAAARRTGAEIVTVGREAGQTWAEAVVASVDERVAVVSVPNVHWTDGALVDLEEVGSAARAAGAALVVDASQSLGAMPLDLERVRPDFLVAVGYKWLLGPLGLSYLYVAEPHREGEPLEENWIVRAGSEDFARLVDYRDEYQPGARRFDVGQRTSFTLVPMAAAALGQVLEWGVAQVAASLRAVTDRLAEGAAAHGIEPLPPDGRGPHLLGLQLPPEALDTVLPALAQANCFAAVRSRSLRLAPHLHTNEADVDRLFGALARVVASG